MPAWLDIDQLHLSSRRPTRSVPRVMPGLLRFVELHGPVQPVVVRPDGESSFEILSNAETWLAVQQLGGHRVPVQIRTDIDDDVVERLLALEHSDGAEDPIGEASTFAERLAEAGGRKRRGSVTRVAREVGRSRSYVAHALRLLELPTRIQAMVKTGQLTAGHARALLSVRLPHRQLRLAERCAREGLSVRKLEQLARGVSWSPMADTSPRGGGDRDVDVSRLEARLSEHLGCSVRLDTDDGSLMIRYGGNAEVLQGVLERIGYREE